uniref:glutaredoxin-dependent peroxiredoxin n=1 Tax=Chlamydomonas euryale TaxID=1486919 RepID=A0A7R9V5A6_9CHLO|mmetsp:Transcript_19610/g.58145  ORF Transcript_19610/g.58145 Transcript_19610/m.58145 type:complete len:209 (+) Transcript_19610:394-1020(+)
MVVGTSCPPIGGLSWLKGNPLVVPSPEHVLVLEFWATWCPPCRQTIPHLTKLQAKYRDSGVVFVGISTDEDAAKASAFVASMGAQMDYTVALDTGGQAYQLMTAAHATGIPHAFIVNRAGVIKYSGHPADPKFEAALQEVAGAAAPPPQRSKEPLPLVTDSYEQLMAKGAKELRAILSDRGIDTRDCLEKSDFARKIVNTCASVTYYK